MSRSSSSPPKRHHGVYRDSFTFFFLLLLLQSVVSSEWSSYAELLSNEQRIGFLCVHAFLMLGFPLKIGAKLSCTFQLPLCTPGLAVHRNLRSVPQPDVFLLPMQSGSVDIFNEDRILLRDISQPRF
jgi:hypothetical protein